MGRWQGVEVEMNKVAAGAVAGLAATVPMTLVMMAMRRIVENGKNGPEPPHQITAQLARKAGEGELIDTPQHAGITGIAHFAYGAMLGALYGGLGGEINAPPVAKGVSYGLAVYAGNYEAMLPAMHILPPAEGRPPDRTILLVVSHVVWGAALGIATDALSRD
jgi:uncharacterized membrane protein YagU involved in acid resistance